MGIDGLKSAKNNRQTRKNRYKRNPMWHLMIELDDLICNEGGVIVYQGYTIASVPALQKPLLCKAGAFLSP